MNLLASGSQSAVLRFASLCLRFGVHGEVDQAIVIVESFVDVGVSIMRLGLDVFLPEPSPHELPHLPLHFIEHTGAIGVMKVADPSPQKRTIALPTINLESSLGSKF